MRKRKIRTANDLARLLVEYGACWPAREYVESYPIDTRAQSIWENCGKPDWLYWLGVRWNPEVTMVYAQKILQRAKTALSEWGSLEPSTCLDKGPVLVRLQSTYLKAQDALRVDHRAAYYIYATDIYFGTLYFFRDPESEVELRLKELRKMW